MSEAASGLSFFIPYKYGACYRARIRAIRRRADYLLHQQSRTAVRQTNPEVSNSV